MRATSLTLREGVSIREAPEGLERAFDILARGGATEDALAVSIEIADDRVHLRERESHQSQLNSFRLSGEY